MGRPRKTAILSGFERTREPDINLLAELTDQARGSRSVTKFAEQCGVNASTMSRIINRRISSLISDELLVAIAANADPESGVTFEKLLKAHGLDWPEGDAHAEKPDFQELLLQKIAELGTTTDEEGEMTFASRGENRIKQNAREIIQNELLKKGFKVSVECDVDILEGDVFPFTADFVVETDALKSEGLSKWAFMVMKEPADISLLHRVFACAYLDSPSEKGIKITIVTFDRMSFFMLTLRMEDLHLKDCISAMMLNAKGRFVEYEFHTDWNGHPSQTSIFKDGNGICPESYYGLPDADERQEDDE